MDCPNGERVVRMKMKRIMEVGQVQAFLHTLLMGPKGWWMSEYEQKVWTVHVGSL